MNDFRARFRLPEGVNYLDGNSLGPPCIDAEEAVAQALADWRTLLIEGWTEADPPWLFLAETLGARLAPLVGAHPDEVIAAGSTTVNVHQLVASLYPGHGRILIDALAFPSDRFAIESQLRLRGLDPTTHLLRVPSRDGYLLAEDDVEAALDQDVTLAVLPAVVYTSGQLLDMPRLTRAARDRGVLLIWDCAHSIGAVPHALSAWEVDAALWCSYKWLNAGPGAVGGLYWNRRHHGRVPGLTGWFGARKEALFDRDAPFVPAGGAGGLQLGTTPVLSLAPLAGALNLFEEAGIEALRERSLALTGRLMERATRALSGFGMRVVTPIEPERRGGHVALAHPEAGALCRALRREGVLPDHRPPDLIRFAPAPLYTTESECDEAIDRLRSILTRGAHRNDNGPALVP